jgi:hypothetical protein
MPMPIPKVTMTFSISSSLVKLIFSYGIDGSFGLRQFGIDIMCVGGGGGAWD